MITFTNDTFTITASDTIYEQVIALYEITRYSDVDWEQRPLPDDMAQEFEAEFLDGLEVELADNPNINNIVLGYKDHDLGVNRFLRIMFNIDGDNITITATKTFNE